MTGSFFSKFQNPSQRQMRLRHVFHLGIKIEQQAETFYKRFAKLAKDVDVQRLCLKLAHEENQHARLIENKLSRWKSLPFNPTELEILDKDGKLQKLFTEMPPKNAAIDEFVSYAIDQEQQMVLFYESFKPEFSNSWKLKRLRELIDEEKRHVTEWSELHPV
ncbi:MAG: ferritin family protein [Thermodesulfobacteriota bacterium]